MILRSPIQTPIKGSLYRVLRELGLAGLGWFILPSASIFGLVGRFRRRIWLSWFFILAMRGVIAHLKGCAPRSGCSEISVSIWGAFLPRWVFSSTDLAFSTCFARDSLGHCLFWWVVRRDPCLAWLGSLLVALISTQQVVISSHK